MADREHMRALIALLGAFFVGGVSGAVGFRTIGFLSTVPLAIRLLILAAVPVYNDLKARFFPRAH